MQTGGPSDLPEFASLEADLESETATQDEWATGALRDSQPDGAPSSPWEAAQTEIDPFTGQPPPDAPFDSFVGWNVDAFTGAPRSDEDNPFADGEDDSGNDPDLAASKKKRPPPTPVATGTTPPGLIVSERDFFDDKAGVWWKIYTYADGTRVQQPNVEGRSSLILVSNNNNAITGSRSQSQAPVQPAAPPKELPPLPPPEQSLPPLPAEQSPPQPPPPPPPPPQPAGGPVGSPAPAPPPPPPEPDWTTQTEWRFPEPDSRLFQPINSLDTGNRPLNFVLNKVLLPWENARRFAANIPLATLLGIDDALKGSPVQMEYRAAQDLLPLSNAMGIAVEAAPALEYGSAWLSNTLDAGSIARRAAFAQQFSAMIGKEAGMEAAMTVDGVGVGGIRVSVRDGQLVVSRNMIVNISRIPGQGKRVHSAFEAGAIDAARNAGLKSVRVGVQSITRPAWREYLESNFYDWGEIHREPGSSTTGLVKVFSF